MKNFDVTLLLAAIVLILAVSLSSCSTAHKAPTNQYAKNIQKHKRPHCEKRYTRYSVN